MFFPLCFTRSLYIIGDFSSVLNYFGFAWKLDRFLKFKQLLYILLRTIPFKITRNFTIFFFRMKISQHSDRYRTSKSIAVVSNFSLNISIYCCDVIFKKILVFIKSIFVRDVIVCRRIIDISLYSL